MIGRVGRLVAAEFLKLFSHRFLYVCLGLLAILTPLIGLLQPVFEGFEETEWRSFHSVQIFTYGFGFGLKIATFVILIFSSMMFAGEFDRGTVKNLLTCPVTRTDVFLAKCGTVVLLGVLLFLFVLYVALVTALLGGDLGHVWTDDVYELKRGYPEIIGYARETVMMTFLPLLAVGFMGILVSTWTESSGYAVAIALVTYLVLDFGVGIMGEEVGRNVFLHHGPYALKSLRRLSEGGVAPVRWSEVVAGLRWVTVPAAYVAGFVPLAYVFFRARNIHA